MPPAAPGRTCQFRVQVHKDRAGDVPGPYAGSPGGPPSCQRTSSSTGGLAPADSLTSSLAVMMGFMGPILAQHALPRTMP